MKRVVSRIIGWVGRDALLLHTALLFIATMVASVCNVGFQAVISRALPKSEYALLATFLALVAIASRPLATLNTALTHYCSILVKDGRSGMIRRLLAKWFVLTGVPSIILAVFLVLFAPHIAGFFHLERKAPVIVLALAMPVIFVTPVLSGGIFGVQRFGWAAVSTILGAVGRVLLGTTFVLLIAPACGWALAGHVGAMYISFVFYVLVLLRFVRGSKVETQGLPSLRLYLTQCFMIQVAAAVLMTGDVVFVQHYLPDDCEFAFAATLGRIVTFLSISVAAAMFPKVSSSGAFTRKNRTVYLKSQLYTLLLSLAALVFCLVFAPLLIKLLFNISSPSSLLVAQTRWMALAMTISSLLNINISLLIAQKRFRCLVVVMAASALYFLGVMFFHGSAMQVVMQCIVANLIALVVTTVWIVRDLE